MANVQDITRGLQAIRTVAQAKVAIGEVLNEIGRAFTAASSADLPTSDLNKARIAIEQLWSGIKALPDSTAYSFKSPGNLDTVIKGYVEVEGITGHIVAAQTVSYWTEVKEGFEKLPENIGAGTETIAEIIARIIGGFIKGLGPMTLIILLLVVGYVVLKRKGLSLLGAS